MSPRHWNHQTKEVKGQEWPTRPGRHEGPFIAVVFAKTEYEVERWNAQQEEEWCEYHECRWCDETF